MLKYPKDLTGIRFGEWEVIRYAQDREWLCRCSCGTEQIISRDALVGNRTHKCKKCSGKNKRIDLMGRIFGKLEVIDYDVDKGKWICKCKCGNIIMAKSQKLRYNLTTCCSICSNKSVLIDITNNTYGEWKTLSYLGDGFWECECSCGKIRPVHGRRLRNGSSTNCGHIRDNNKLIDLIGKRFGEWDVIEHVGGQFWKCKCSCGEIRNIRSTYLRNGNSTSCSHTKLIINLVGMRFGRLHVDYYNRETGKWSCTCDCGNILEVYSHNLRNENTKSCGCILLDKLLKKEYFEDIIDRLGEYADILDIAYEINRSIQCTKQYIDRYKLWNRIKPRYGSVLEKDVALILDDIGCTYQMHNRSILQGLELDFFIPKFKIAIEVNGCYWHSDVFKDKSYHKYKATKCMDNGINLISIQEYELEDEYRRNKIEQYIRNILNDSAVIHFKDVELTEIKRDEANEFIENNCIDEELSNIDDINIACKYKNDIIAVMVLGKLQFVNEYDYEIKNFCYKLGTRVVDVNNKIFEWIVGRYSINNIIAYTDLSKFNGDMYSEIGMKCIGSTDPSYVWYSLYWHNIVSKYYAQKSSMNYGRDINEDKFMENNEYIRIYDCGKLKFEWRR